MAAVLNIDAALDLMTLRETSAIGLQKTLANSIRLSGMGLHSGGETSVHVHPADDDTGIVFSDGKHEIRALATHVVDTSRGTNIGFNGTRIRTIEHLLSALRGCGVDNAIVEVVGPEMPALDGSALPYVEAIAEVGLLDLATERKPIVLKEPVCVRHNDSFILAVPAPKLSITYVLNYDHPMIGSQTIHFSPDENDFCDEIAPARTFVLYEEVAALLNDGLSKGGTIDNVIVVWQDRTSSELRFRDELARHKVLDLIGDMSLIGASLQAEVLAVKSGHTLNVEFAKEVLRAQE